MAITHEPHPPLIGLLRGVLVLWVALTLAFGALRLLPGDAVSATLRESSQADIQDQRERLGLDDPWYVQYGRYLMALARGDLGQSFVSSEPVSSMILARAGPTFSLGMAAFAVAITLGVGLGLANSVNEHCALCRFSDGLIVLSQAVPFYVTALVAVYLFSLELALLPASGSRTPAHLILPSLTLGFHTAGSIARVLSVNLREVYRQPFMLTARAKGLPPLDLLDHALRVAILPTLSVLAIQAGFLLSGTVIIEVMFVRRGLGSLLYRSVLDRDYPVVQALTLLGVVVYMLAIGAGAAGRRFLDPRLR